MEGQDVLHRLLAEKVVDARFIEDLVQLAVQADRAGQVGVEGLKDSSSALRARSSLRRARSPVAPNRTTTCGNRGPTPGGILAKRLSC